MPPAGRFLKKVPQKLSGHIHDFPSFLGKIVDVIGTVIWINLF